MESVLTMLMVQSALVLLVTVVIHVTRLLMDVVLRIHAYMGDVSLAAIPSIAFARRVTLENTVTEEILVSQTRAKMVYAISVLQTSPSIVYASKVGAESFAMLERILVEVRLVSMVHAVQMVINSYATAPKAGKEHCVRMMWMSAS